MEQIWSLLRILKLVASIEQSVVPEEQIAIEFWSDRGLVDVVVKIVLRSSLVSAGTQVYPANPNK